MELTYLNPVYPSSFPDPFVLKWCGVYWAYCTGIWKDGRCFGILSSPDLIHWREWGGAMAALPDESAGPYYWAPEVTYHNGRFLLYYSVGNEELMQMRVAVADHPAGPFVDSGRQLTTEPFAIDGHVFIDDDGAWHFFYASDFLTHSHIGTGTVCDRMRDPFTLAGQPRPVTLPRYDWHVYDPQRASKGGVRWHTVEGPFVLKRKGRYYQMFSGGNWQNLSYGVSYALSDQIDTPSEWTQVADGERVLPILRTVPGHVVGPGHNSVVRGPDNRQLFCVYHRWSADTNERVMAIDRLEWVGERMLVDGPSTTPQPAPLAPSLADDFATTTVGLGPQWECQAGEWSRDDGAALQRATNGAALACCRYTAPCFVAEISLRALDGLPAEGEYGIGIDDEFAFLLAPAQGQAIVRTRRDDAQWEEQRLALPPQFDPHVYHLLRVEFDDPALQISLDDRALRWSTRLPVQRAAGCFNLRTNHMAAAFCGFALTYGWEELFEAELPLAARGWQSEQAGWQISDGVLQQQLPQPHALISRGPPLAAYELLINARLDSLDTPDARYGFYPALTATEPGPLLTVERSAAGWALCWRGPGGSGAFALPASFDPTNFQQFRLRKQAAQLTIQWEAQVLGSIAAPSAASAVGLYAHMAIASFEMVRTTALELP